MSSIPWGYINEDGAVFNRIKEWLLHHWLLEKADLGFPHSSVSKESACNAGDPGSIPGLGRSPGEGIGYPLQYFWAPLVVQLVKNLPAMQETGFDPWVGKIPWRRERPGEVHGLCSPRDRKESDTTERLSLTSRAPLVHCSWPLQVCKNQFFQSPLNPTFTDRMREVWNWTQWLYLHHGNQQMLKNREQVVERLPTHHWLQGPVRGSYTPPPPTSSHPSPFSECADHTGLSKCPAHAVGHHHITMHVSRQTQEAAACLHTASPSLNGCVTFIF